MQQLEQNRDWVRLVGGVVFAVGMLLIFTRKSEPWANFPLLLVLAAPCVLLLGLALTGAQEGAGLSGWQSTFLVTGIILLLLTLIQLARVLGVDQPLQSSHSGAPVWTFGIAAATAMMLSLRFDSRVNMLLGALLAAFAGLSLVDWIGSNPGYKTFRWVLIVEAIVFLAVATQMRAERPDQANYLVDAAGVTAVLAGSIGYLASAVSGALAAAFAGGTTSAGGQGNGWELFLLVVSLLLIAYTAWQNYRGSAYIGFVGLLLFTLTVSGSTSLWAWPLILAIGGALAVAASMVGAEAPGGPSGAPADGGGETRAAGAPPAPPPPPGAP